MNATHNYITNNNQVIVVIQVSSN